MDDSEAQILTQEGVMIIPINSINDLYLNKPQNLHQPAFESQNDDQVMEEQPVAIHQEESKEVPMDVSESQEDIKKKERELNIAKFNKNQRNNHLKRIKKQMEYYFGDKNYYQDKYLLDAVSKSENGFVPISDFMTFNKLVRMRATENLIIEAIKESEIWELNSENTGVRKANINSNNNIIQS